MYAESAYWVLSAIMMVTATLIGFVLVSAVFFAERFKGYFDQASGILYAFEGISPEELRISDKDFDLVRSLVMSAFKGLFHRFLITLVLSSLLGVLIILVAMTSLVALPPGDQPLSTSAYQDFAVVEVLFGLFVLTTVMVVTYWVYSGFDMTVFKSRDFQNLRFMIEQLHVVVLVEPTDIAHQLHV